MKLTATMHTTSCKLLFCILRIICMYVGDYRSVKVKELRWLVIGILYAKHNVTIMVCDRCLKRYYTVSQHNILLLQCSTWLLEEVLLVVALEKERHRWSLAVLCPLSQSVKYLLHTCVSQYHLWMIYCWFTSGVPLAFRIATLVECALNIMGHDWCSPFCYNL